VCITADHSLGQHETRDAAISDRARRLALAVCLAAGFTTLLDSSILNLAVPSLAGSLPASAEQVQWLLASYSLTFGLALVPDGPVTAPALSNAASPAVAGQQLTRHQRSPERRRRRQRARPLCDG
jgi:MFS family permease